MKNSPYNRLLPYRLWFIAETVEDYLETFYRGEFGLSRSEWRVISTLSFEKSLTAGQLAAWTSLDRTRVSQCLARLTSENLITRTTHEQDRRKIVIELTPKGERIVAKIYPLAAELEKKCMKALAPREHKALLEAVATLEKLALSGHLAPIWAKGAPAPEAK